MAGLVLEQGPDHFEMQCFPLISFVKGRNGWSGPGARTRWLNGRFGGRARTGWLWDAVLPFDEFCARGPNGWSGFGERTRWLWNAVLPFDEFCARAEWLVWWRRKDRMTMRCSASPSTALYWPQVKTLTIPFLNSIIDVLLVVGYKHTVSRMISCTKLLLYTLCIQ